VRSARHICGCDWEKVFLALINLDFCRFALIGAAPGYERSVLCVAFGTRVAAKAVDPHAAFAFDRSLSAVFGL
jgi:hypothetical protein